MNNFFPVMRQSEMRACITRIHSRQFCLLFAACCTILYAVSLVGMHSQVHRLTLRTQSSYENKPKRFRGNLTVRFGGRLGNHMFQYAALYSIAKTQNLKAIMECAVDIECIFTLGKDVVIVSEKLEYEKMETFREIRCCGYDNRVEKWKFKDGTTSLLYECLQSWKYFEKYQDDIRRFFRFQSHIEESVRDILGRITAMGRLGTTWVGVHVRRGDKVDDLKYPSPRAGYFRRAMNFYRKEYSDVTFVVCSDDIEWSKIHIKSRRNDTYFMKGNDAEVDLAILAHMNHTIMSVGTFGWWGGWLAGGRVVYFKNFVVPEKVEGEEFDFATFYPPDWIGIE